MEREPVSPWRVGRVAKQRRWLTLCALVAGTGIGCAEAPKPAPQQPITPQNLAAVLPPLPNAPPAVAPPAANVRPAAYVSEGPPDAVPRPANGPQMVPPADGLGANRPNLERQPGPELTPKPEFQPPGLTLPDALAATLRSDPKLRAAVEGIRQAEGDYVTSSLPPNPTVQVNGLFLPLRTITPTRPGGPPELDVIGSYPIDWWVFGKRAAAMVNARIGVDVANADYCDQVRQRLANTASAYFDVLEARAMHQLAEEDLANLQHVEQVTVQGVRLGGAGTIEAERVRLSVLDAQREARSRASALITARAQFRAAIGRPAQMAETDAQGNLDVIRPAAALPLADAISLAERNRPDIISLHRQIDQARSAIAVEQTKARAQLTPSLGYQQQWQGAEDLADFPSFTAQMAVVVPLFDRNQGNIAKAESSLTQASYNLQAQLVQAEADVEQAVSEFRTAADDVTAIGPPQLAAARSVRDRTETAYRLGGKTLLDLLDAERAYRDTHRTYILSQSAYWHALYKLNAAVGQQVLQ